MLATKEKKRVKIDELKVNKGARHAFAVVNCIGLKIQLNLSSNFKTKKNIKLIDFIGNFSDRNKKKLKLKKKQAFCLKIKFFSFVFLKHKFME